MKLLIAFSAIFLIHGLSYASTGAHGTFRVVKGKVSIKSAQTGEVSRARVGSKVLPGDVISTEKDSRAKVVMVDNNEINISPESEIKIEKYEFDPNQNKKDVLLNVIYGKVRSKVEQKYDGKTSKFQVKTKAAVAGVRGTDFITGYTASTGVSQVITFEGRVEFGVLGANGQVLNPVSVVPGQMVEVELGSSAPAQPQAVPQENLRQMDTESNAETADSSASNTTAPAPQGNSSGEKKADAQSDSAQSDTAPKSESPRAGAERQPSSDGRMIQERDLPSSPSGGPSFSGPPTPPSIPMIPSIENTCGQACRDIIQHGNTNLKITVQQ